MHGSGREYLMVPRAAPQVDPAVPGFEATVAMGGRVIFMTPCLFCVENH
jgi:hypothetical protein